MFSLLMSFPNAKLAEFNELEKRQELTIATDQSC